MAKKKGNNISMIEEGDKNENQELRIHLDRFSAKWLIKRAEDTWEQII